jgi:hypothetical protein
MKKLNFLASIVLALDLGIQSVLLDIQLDDGLEFSFTDKRRFARVRLFEDVSTFTSSF